jgi:hypothetical protein
MLRYLFCYVLNNRLYDVLVHAHRYLYFWNDSCSVVGLHFDYVVFNLTKHSSYLIYNAVLYFSPVVQRQYHEKYGFDEVLLCSISS